MAKQGVWRRWAPFMPDRYRFMTNYLRRMSKKDSLPASYTYATAFACGGGLETGWPDRFDLERSEDPERLGNIDPIVEVGAPSFWTGTMQWTWAVSSEESGPLTYALILFVRTVGFLEFAGSVREWPQEGVQEPLRDPWRYNWPMKVTNVTFPNRFFYYEQAPCWNDCTYEGPSGNRAQRTCAVFEFRNPGINGSCDDVLIRGKRRGMVYHPIVRAADGETLSKYVQKGFEI